MIINTQNRKQWLGFILVLLVVGFLVWLGPSGWYQKFQNTQQLTDTAYTLSGQVVEIKDAEIIVSNVHIKDAGGNSQPGVESPKSATVKFNSGTKFVKTVWYMPSIADITNRKIKIDINNIKRETGPGMISDIQKNNYIIVKFAQTTLNPEKILASEVDYVTIVHAQ